MKEEERIKIIKELNKGCFLNEATKLLSESKKDTSVSKEEHKQLFMFFIERVNQLFTTPEAEETAFIRSLKRIALLQFLEKKEVKLVD